MPDASSVFASESSCDHVFGAVTPAALKAGTLYQSNDLFDALKTSAYSLLLNVPIDSHDGAKFCEITDFAYVIGFRWPCCTSCFTYPGAAMSAMSGGLPPVIAVASTVVSLLPSGLYLILTFG